ncbi:hypothetical protein DEJ39_07655 [Bacteroidetes bacterium SCGC AAA795-G10]|nr:hypothetical protein DEJ39_07655 [Bacteroidetes bacterium SCGC AAA795-G10]
MSKKLIDTKDSLIVHYGSSTFEISEHQVYWIGAVYYENDQKKYFFADKDEKDSIERFAKFLEQNAAKTIVHWSMNSPKFGFSPIEKRYKELTSKTINIKPLNQLDLSEYFKEKYGINYISREEGRLNNLAKLNGFTGFKNNIEVRSKADASDRLELIFSIYQAELQGKLKISRSAVFNRNMWNERCFELFKYLTDNYYTSKSVQLTSIWFFLRDLESQDYLMHCTKEDYKNYINTYYNLEIKHFDRPSNWSEKKRILNDFRINFENT